MRFQVHIDNEPQRHKGHKVTENSNLRMRYMVSRDKSLAYPNASYA